MPVFDGVTIDHVFSCQFLIRIVYRNWVNGTPESAHSVSENGVDKFEWEEFFINNSF